MNKIFNINFEFDSQKANAEIRKLILDKQKGYVCAVDSNIVSIANKNVNYLQVINNSVLNICDGGTIAAIGRWIYKKPFERYTGPDLFIELISKGYRQAFLGNTPDNLYLLQKKMQGNGIDTGCCLFQPLPFCSIDDFDYASIADEIRFRQIDLIWISLGAPKQELFAARLQSYLDHGVTIAVGAAFNFYIATGNYHRAPQWMQIMNIEWVYRLFLEPKKQVKRILYILKVYPGLIIYEYMRKYKQSIKAKSAVD